jgi:hypothetical protein
MELDPKSFLFENMGYAVAADTVMRRMLDDRNMRKMFLRTYLIVSDAEKYQRTPERSIYSKNALSFGSY